MHRSWTKGQGQIREQDFTDATLASEDGQTREQDLTYVTLVSRDNQTREQNMNDVTLASRDGQQFMRGLFKLLVFFCSRLLPGFLIAGNGQYRSNNIQGCYWSYPSRQQFG